MNSHIYKLFLLLQFFVYTIFYFLIPRHRAVRILFCGKFIEVLDFASFYAIYKSVFIDQLYCFSKNKNNNFLIVDVGANVGLSVVFFLTKYPNSKVIAVEADPRVYEILVKNVKKFDLKKRVVLVNKALWSKNGEKLLFYPDGADGGRLGKKLNNVKPIKIDTICLKDLSNKHIDFVKIDIEGAEYEVVKTQISLLKKVNKMFIEYHSFRGNKQNISKLLGVICKSGFRIRSIQSAMNNKLPFINELDNLGMDLQLNIFLVRR